MSSAAVTNIVVGLAVVAWVVYRQLTVRAVRERNAARLVLVLTVIGVIEIVQTAKGHRVDPAAVGWIALSLVIGAGLGAARGLSMRIWRDGAGMAWQRGSAWTAGLWLVSLGVHFGLDALIDDSTTAKGLGAASILLYLGITLGTQREVIRARAARSAAGVG